MLNREEVSSRENSYIMGPVAIVYQTQNVDPKALAEELFERGGVKYVIIPFGDQLGIYSDRRDIATLFGEEPGNTVVRKKTFEDFELVLKLINGLWVKPQYAD